MTNLLIYDHFNLNLKIKKFFFEYSQNEDTLYDEKIFTDAL